LQTQREGVSMAVELSICAQKKNKKRRAVRARARSGRAATIYAIVTSPIFRPGQLSILTFEDPYGETGRVDGSGNLDITARLEQARLPDGSIAEGQPGGRPLVTAAANLREDPLGRMYARHQIDAAQFQGAQAYQEASDRSVLGTVSSSVNTTRFVSCTASSQRCRFPGIESHALWTTSTAG
jgi:hypothetical protein